MSVSKEKNKFAVPLDMQSLVNSHEEPFVVIDAEYRIVAVNRAYEKTFGVSAKQAIGQACYRISHHNDAPCHETGEDCPHANLFKIGKKDSCLHIHYGADHRMCRVEVKAYPLRASNGQLFMGELIHQLPGDEDCCASGKQMIGSSAPFMACLEQLEMVAKVPAPVLLQGETGVGKELAAHYIHNHSSRKEKPFLTMDGTVLTESLFEAEVFGHARGAYTGSIEERTGLYEQANGGTLFLDEIGELPLAQQAKLLRVLETGQYRRVGCGIYREADVRVICATNRHLWEDVSAGRFREDLYYRIACLAVRLPPLRERLEDIALLASRLLEPISQSRNQDIALTPGAVERLKLYEYPGNVRELRNILFIAAAHNTTGVINGAAINEVMVQQQLRRKKLRTRAAVVAPETPPEQVTRRVGTLHDVEARHIAELLHQHPNSRSEVAASLGISVRTLYRKIRRYHLN